MLACCCSLLAALPIQSKTTHIQDGTDAEARRRRARLLGLADGEEGEEEGDAEVIAGTDRLQVR